MHLGGALWVRGTGQERDAVSLRRPPGRRNSTTVPEQHLLGARRDIHHYQVAAVTVLVVVRARHEDQHRVPIGGHLRVGDADDAPEIRQLHVACLRRDGGREREEEYRRQATNTIQSGHVHLGIRLY